MHARSPNKLVKVPLRIIRHVINVFTNSYAKDTVILLHKICVLKLNLQDIICIMEEIMLKLLWDYKHSRVLYIQGCYISAQPKYTTILCNIKARSRLSSSKNKVHLFLH